MPTDTWTVTYGINDMKSGWVKIPHRDLERLLLAPSVAAASLLLAEKTERPKEERLPFADNSDGKCFNCDQPAIYFFDGRPLGEGERGYCEYHIDRIADNGKGTILDKRRAATAHAKGNSESKEDDSGQRWEKGFRADYGEASLAIKQEQRDRMAHARAVAAERRAAGLLPKKKSRKRKRKRLKQSKKGRKTLSDADVG